MDPIIGAGLIEGAGSLFGGIINAFSQSSANKTNIQLSRENRDWQESMWEKQNAYNTPAAQIARLKDAGLNPALMYSQGNVGNADAVKGVDTPHVQPITGLGQGIASAGSSIAQTLIDYERVKQMRAQSVYMQAKANQVASSTLSPYDYWQMGRAKIRALETGADYSEAKAIGQDTYNRFESNILSNQVRSGELSNTNLQLQMAIDIAEISLKNLMTQSNIRLNNARISQIKSLVGLLNQKFNFLEKLNPQQIQQVVSNIVKTNADVDYTRHRIDLEDDRFWMDLIYGGIKAASNLMPSPAVIP